MATLAELLARREALEQEIEATKKRERADAIARVRALMDEYGLTVADLTTRSAPKAAAGKTRKAAVKYRDKETGQTWSGRGLQPNWLKAKLAAGRRLEDFLV